MRRQRFWFALALHAGLLPLALLWLAPLWLMVVFATHPEQEIFRVPVPLLPGDAFMENWASLQADTNFLRALANSVVVSGLYTLGGLLLSALAGYALAVYEFRFKALVFSFIVATLTIPYFVVVIPQYILVARDLKLTNTYWGVILPFLANALGVFYMRQVFLSLPSSLLDAARVDGAGEGRIFFQIALPLVRPSLAALALILFLNAWNDYLWPLLILSQKDMYTAPVALGTLIGLTRVSWGGIMVGSALMTVPFLVLFLFLQRYFVAGITAGAVKE
ncbi:MULTISPECIES: carbohydrate ABC transporter permease [Thermus]|uniref:carbohydrate ABC transporter permease n=1 Tax=Thermus TaxID=270 RepID=UPI001F186EAD|nr:MULTISPECIES: carbohydrate ABC transporter permease [Thermus]